MKIIDQTPFYNHDTGAITTLDRLKALLKFGPTWTREIEAQAQVIPIITKLLDRSFTLLRNVTPPGLDADSRSSSSRSKNVASSWRCPATARAATAMDAMPSG